MPMGGINEGGINSLNVKVFPNPFTASVHIQYELDDPSSVQIMIFNGKGELIFIEEDPAQHRGRQTFTWRPANLADGIYYLMIQSNKGKASVKLLKQK
jgi:hypothetical protein